VTTEPTHLPLPLESDWLDWVGARGEQQLALARSLVEGLRNDPPREPLEVLRVWNDAQTALSNAASVGSLFSEVHPDEAVRERAESVAQQVQKLDTDLGLDTGLYAVLAGLDTSGPDADAARVLERTLRDFHPEGYPGDHPMVPHGMAVALTAPEAFRWTFESDPARHLAAARLLDPAHGARWDSDERDVLPGVLVDLMRDIGLPNGLEAVGYDEHDVGDLVEGSLKQQRLLATSPREVGADDLDGILRRSLQLWD